MKSICPLALVVLLLLSCIQHKEKDPYDEAYRDITGRMAEQLNRLGHYEFSPDGKDSLWYKTDATVNLNLLDSVITEYDSVQREWDSLIFLARKYDSISHPSELIFNRWKTVNERRIFLNKYRKTLSESVRLGIYDRNGKQLIDIDKVLSNVD